VNLGWILSRSLYESSKTTLFVGESRVSSIPFNVVVVQTLPLESVREPLPGVAVALFCEAVCAWAMRALALMRNVRTRNVRESILSF
jgi:hypothetical protein